MEATMGRCIMDTPDSKLATRSPLCVMVAIVSSPMASAGVTMGDLATQGGEYKYG
ncbi:hypothetical protein BS17DRAFT_778743 [Gyrodon lividus]|nr:hypothetical protein BS17DRAFT_778743 [Gyrodon lividus]